MLKHKHKESEDKRVVLETENCKLSEDLTKFKQQKARLNKEMNELKNERQNQQSMSIEDLDESKSCKAPVVEVKKNEAIKETPSSNQQLKLLSHMMLTLQ